MTRTGARTLGGALLAGLIIGAAIGLTFDHLLLGLIIGLALGVLAFVLRNRASH